MAGTEEIFRLLPAAVVPTAAAVLSVVLILALRPLLQRYALARPNARSSHSKPTPQGGGIAVIISTIVVGATAIAALETTAAIPATALVATALIAVVGGIDDLRPMPVLPRLLLQGLAIAVAIAALPAEMRVVPQLPWWGERLCLLVGLLWFVNLANFMDGIDWMTVAEVVPVTGATAVLGLTGMAALPPSATLLALALLGATVGFAPFNKPVARLFLGDVGSLPIGLLVGWLLVQLAASGQLAAALLLPLYYLADATITLLRRVAAGEPFWQAHRSHFYQRARDHGWSVREVAGRVFAINLALAGLATVTVEYRSTPVVLTALGSGAALVALLLASFMRGRR